MIRRVVGYGALSVCLVSVIAIMAVENSVNPTSPGHLQSIPYTAFVVGFLCVGPRFRRTEQPHRFRLGLQRRRQKMGQ